MNSLFICNLLLFLLVYADTANSQVHYYITPSLNGHCPGGPCLTLAQFAADSTSYFGNETNISLSFLPGSHCLDGELSLSHVDNFSMTKDTGSNGTVFVECGSQSRRFSISETTSATIKDLHFIGCGGNRVSQVEQFIVEDTIFQGMEGRGTALALNVTDSIVSDSTADRSCGVILAGSGSIISIHSSTFTNNSAAQDGGVMRASGSSFNITNSTFTNNSVARYVVSCAYLVPHLISPTVLLPTTVQLKMVVS